jgi:hypothetical protein
MPFQGVGYLSREILQVFLIGYTAYNDKYKACEFEKDLKSGSENVFLS